MSSKIKIISLMALIILVLSLVVYLVVLNSKANLNMIYGVSFSPQYARYLGFDAQELFKKVLDDLKFKHIRLSAQWDDLERTSGQYDFKELDWLMAEAAKRQAKIILAVGRKTPRWPECHLPDWAKTKEYKDYRPQLLKYITAVAERYKNHSALEIWQVENEPFLAFGLCQPMSRNDLQEEIDLVKKIDRQHKIMVTDSGELSTWRKTAKVTDLFGTTMYRVVWNKWLGYFSYDWLPVIFYQAKLKLMGRSYDTAYIVELQAEPWAPDHLGDKLTLGEQFKSMNILRLKKNIEYANRVGLPRAYLWGAEWWYWLEKNYGQIEFTRYIKTLKKE